MKGATSAAVSTLLAKLDALLQDGTCKLKRTHITFLRDELQQTQDFLEFMESECYADEKSYSSSCLVGVDGPRDRLSKLLLQQFHENLDIRMTLSILGAGGLGKTTLAREIFCKIQPYFDCVAWVSMSPPYRGARNILEDILHQLDLDGVQDKQYITRAIRESLEHKRYLRSSLSYEMFLSINNFYSDDT